MAISEVNDYWDIRRTAKYLGMSIAFIRKGVRQRSIPFVRIGNKALRFRKADLDRWAEAGGCDAGVNVGRAL